MKWFLTWFSVLIQLYSISAQVFCSSNDINTGFCVYSQRSTRSNNSVELTLVARQALGWMAIGFGPAMNRAEIYAAWMNADGSVTLSRRTSTARVEPRPVPQNATKDFNLITSSKPTEKGGYYITFDRLASPAPVNGIQFSVNLAVDAETPMIWAYSMVQPESSQVDASLQIHTQKGSLQAKLFAASSAPKDTAPIVSTTVMTVIPVTTTMTTTSQTASSTSTPTSTSVNQNNGTTSRDKHYSTIVAHGVFMFLAWFVLAPIGIAIPRYTKSNPSHSNWAKRHTLIMGSVFLFTVIGFICIHQAVGHHHFDTTKYNGTGGMHVVVGLFIFIVLFFQMALGLLNSYLAFKKRLVIKLWKKLHQWTGKTVFLLAFINVPLGLLTLDSIGNNEVSIALIVLLSFYMSGMIIVAFILDLKQAPVAEQPVDDPFKNKLEQYRSSQVEFHSQSWNTAAHTQP